jgi:hypothetical protein
MPMPMPEVEWISDPAMKIRRKKMMPKNAKMPETPKGRMAEVEAMLSDLVELVDHDVYDVYESVFFKRVTEYMEAITFKNIESMKDTNPKKIVGMRMRDTGREIVATKATSTKLFVRFFKSIVDFRS